jgi:serine/threonine protein kinase
MRQEQQFGYEVVSNLGVGMFGEVSKVKRKADGKEFALKVLKEDMVKKSPRILQMLSHEVTGLIGKYHPNMVTLYDAFKINDDNFLIYELCEAESMKTRLRSNGCWSEQNIIELAKSMLLGLHYLHGLGIIHRDIKPDNILIRRGQFKLADFGLCYRGGQHYDNDLIGSPAYLAPEIFKRRFYSEKSDVYALGISLYELYIGKYPFEQKNEIALIKRKMEFLPSKEVMKGASEAFVNLLRFMVHPNFEKRASVGNLLKMLNLDPSIVAQMGNPDEDEFQIVTYSNYIEQPALDPQAQNYYHQAPTHNAYDAVYQYQTQQPNYEAYDYQMPNIEPMAVPSYAGQDYMGGAQTSPYMYQPQQQVQYMTPFENAHTNAAYSPSHQDIFYQDQPPAQVSHHEEQPSSHFNNLFNVTMFDRVMVPKSAKKPVATRTIFTDDVVAQPLANSFSRNNYVTDQRNLTSGNHLVRQEHGFSGYSQNHRVGSSSFQQTSESDRSPNLLELHQQLHNAALLKATPATPTRNVVTQDGQLNLFQLRNSSFASPQPTHQPTPTFHRADTLGVPSPSHKASERSFSTQPITARSRRNEGTQRLVSDPFVKNSNTPVKPQAVTTPLAPKKDYNNLINATLLPPKGSMSSNRAATSSTNNLVNMTIHPNTQTSSRKYSRYLESNSENNPQQAVNVSLASEVSASTNSTTLSGEHSYQKTVPLVDGAAQPSLGRSRNILPTSFNNQQFSMALLNSHAAQEEAKQILNEITAMNDKMLFSSKNGRTRKGGNLLF